MGIQGVMRLLRTLFRQDRAESDLAEELQFHLQNEIQKNIAAGMSPEAARYTALRSFGGVDQVKEKCRDMRGARFVDELWQDARYGLRMLLKNPSFAAVVVLTLALGIGANTAIFSVVNAVLIRALPYHDPEHLVMLWTDNPSWNVGFNELPPTPTDLLDWRSQAQSLDQIAAFKVAWADLSEQGDPERVGGVQVTVNLFPLLGLQPMLGRTFTPEEERPGQNKVVIISHALWERRYGRDPTLIGRTVTMNRERLTVVGIMPLGVDFPRGGEMPSGYALSPRTDVWVPFAEDSKYWQRDDTREFIAIGRLKSGVTLPQAQAEMGNIAQRKANEFPATHAGWTVHLRPLSLQVAGKTRPMLFILLSAVGFVLLKSRKAL